MKTFLSTVLLAVMMAAAEGTPKIDPSTVLTAEDRAAFWKASAAMAVPEAQFKAQVEALSEKCQKAGFVITRDQTTGEPKCALPTPETSNAKTKEQLKAEHDALGKRVCAPDETLNEKDNCVKAVLH